MKYLLIAALASVSLAGMAHAEEFDGPYVGVAAANALGDFDTTASGAATFKLRTYPQAFRDVNGEGFSAQAGYNTTYKGVFVGVELNYNGSDAGQTYRNKPHTVTLLSTIDQITDVRVRFGGEMDDSLFYLFGGAAQADTSVTATSEATRSPVVAARTDKVTGSHSGTVFGGGVSRKVFGPVSAFLEVAHYDLGRENYDFPTASKFGANELKLTANAFKAGVNFHLK